MKNSIESTPSVNDTCEIESITITAFAGKGEIRTDITHTPETTLDEYREPVVVKARSFPARAAQPYVAAERLYEGARARHPHAIVNLVFA